MKPFNIVKRIFAVLFFLAAIAAAVYAVHVIRYADAAELQVNDDEPGGPTERLEVFFGALEEKDFPAAYACLSNYSTLGLENAPEDDIAALFWKAQQDVWDFEILPGHEMNGTKLTKHVRVTCLDAAAISALIGEDVQDRLAAVVEEATAESDVYDENGDYKAEILETALHEAAAEAIKTAPSHTYTREIVMHLEYADGQWLIAADNNLLSALTSGAVR